MIPTLVTRPAFRCLGLEAEGPLRDPGSWIGDLWMRFWRRGREIGVRPPRQTWGLMSAVDIPMAPWGGETGRYLASVEVPDDTESSGDWKVWTVPALTWMQLPCRKDTIGQSIEQARNLLRHDPEWWWEGSVHELYPPGFRDPAAEEFQIVLGLLPR